MKDFILLSDRFDCYAIELFDKFWSHYVIMVTASDWWSVGQRFKQHNST